MNRLRRLLPLLVVLVVLASGCNAPGTGATGFVPGTGGITVLKADQRHKPGPISGTTLEGNHVSLSQYAGKVVVINVWGSWCGPCRSEAAFLAKAATELMPKGVVFLGINTRDNSSDSALAFQRDRGIPYPSIYDPGGRNLLAFDGTLSPSAIPSTVVIDAQGRVAASVLGPLPSAQTLVDMISEIRS